LGKDASNGLGLHVSLGRYSPIFIHLFIIEAQLILWGGTTKDLHMTPNIGRALPDALLNHL